MTGGGPSRTILPAGRAMAATLAMLGLSALPVAPGLRILAVEPPPPVEAEHAVTVFGTEAGLGSEALAAVAFGAHDGRLWVCSFGGLWACDGRDFEDRSDRIGAADGQQMLRSLMADRSGRIWVGGYGRIAGHDGRQERLYGASEGVPGHLVWDLAEAAAGEIWASTSVGLLRREGDRFVEVPAPEAVPQGQTLRIVGQDGRLWCQGPQTLSLRVDGRWEVLARAEPGRAGRLSGIGPARGGGVWVAFEREVRLLREGRWVATHARPPGMQGDTVRLLEDARGNLWMGGWQHGVAVFSPDGRVRTFGRRQGLPNDSVSGLAEDPEGNLWIATNGGGLVRLRPLAFRTFGLESGIGQGINQVVEAAPGRLLLATQGEGILTFEDGVAVPDADRKPGGDPLHPWVSVLHVDRAGVRWAGLAGVGLGRRDAGGWRVIPVEQVGAQQVMSFHEDGSGRLWVGTVAGVAVGRDGVFRSLGPESQAPHAILLSIAGDGAGDLWFSGNQWGLYRFRDNRFHRVVIPGISTNAGFGALLGAQDGSVWVTAGEEGLAWIRDGKPTVLGAAHGLVPLDSMGVIEDSAGDLWVAARNAVARITRESAEAVASGRRGRLEVRYFDRRDGLAPLSGQSWWQGMRRTSDGRLWFPTTRGLAVVDPRRLPPGTPPPAVEIASVRGPEGQAWSHADGRPFEMPYRGQAMEVVHRVRVLGTPEAVRYESRLLPGGAWRDIGASRSTLLRDLRPGAYRLEIRASVNALEWGAATGLDFRVLPPFWATGWFVALAGTIGVGSVVWIVRRILRARYRRRLQALETEAAVDRERVRIARDLHDDLGATMTQIALALERASVAGTGGSDPAMAEVREGLEATRRGMASLSAAVWSIQPGHQGVSDLACFLADHASRFLRQAGLACEVDLPEQFPGRLLSAEVRHHLVLMVREALNNVVRHAAASRVRLAVTADAEALGLVIEDDGRGPVPPSQPAADGGNGRRNLGARAEAIGARFSIDLRPGGGTRVSIVLPWRDPR